MDKAGYYKNINTSDWGYTMKEKLLALTFDDGPNTTVTPMVLDRLERFGVPATFFVIGQNLTKEVLPMLKRQGELGCEWGNHSWSHPDMSDMTKEEIMDEIKYLRCFDLRT